MPLESGKSRETFSHNVATETIAYSKARGDQIDSAKLDAILADAEEFNKKLSVWAAVT